MGQIKKSIVIDDEDILNLKHCIERTQNMWEYGNDLWPFVIMDIIKRYDEIKELTNEFSN